MSIKLPARKLVSQSDASLVKNAKVPRSKFTNRYGRLTTFNAGYLVPFLVEPMIPGDHFKYRITPYVRMATPLFPLFSNQRVDTFLFFTPMRLVWENFTKMMGEQRNPGSSIDYDMPKMDSPAGGYVVGSIYDHMGLPTAGQLDPAGVYRHQTLPLRAYNLIYNQWFRDQNLQNSITDNYDDGDDAVIDYALMYRAKSHDYFTSALPWTQKFTAPTVPIGGLAPIEGLGFSQAGVTVDNDVAVYDTASHAHVYNLAVKTSNANQAYVEAYNAGGVDYPKVYADLTSATGVAITALRQAFLIQTLLERDARGGTRYVELIKSHFGVINPDFRLQRPEYIGGGNSPINITPIAQTAPTTGVPLGALGAAGTAVGQHTASYAATEHGYVIGLINVRTELAYQQGVPRHWNWDSRYDLPWPELTGLSEQAILMREIYVRGIENDSNDFKVFGYQERYQDLRQPYSTVTGLFKSTSTGNIDEWHLIQEFSAQPTLGDTFINDNPPMARVLAGGINEANKQYIADILIERTAVRPIPVFGTPVTLGRF